MSPSKPAIVLLDSLTLGEDVDLTPLESLGDFRAFDLTPAAETSGRIAGASIVVANKVILDRATLEGAPTVRLVALTATGTNNVDTDYCREAGVAVTNVAGYSTESVAQHTLALVLQLVGRMPYYQRYCASGEYASSPFFTHFGPQWHELSGMRWGIVGLGAIGRRVAGLANAFGARVAYHSTSGRTTHPTIDHLDLDELLGTSDVVTVHAPLNAKTAGLIGERELGLMKPDALLVNVARGGIVDEAALAAALLERRIGGAATDVFEREPFSPGSPLARVLGTDTFLATPHSAWLSVEARRRLVAEVARNVEAFLSGERRNRVV